MGPLAGIRVIETGNLFYTPALGLPELREAIARFYKERYDVTVPASRIIITSGASGALLLAIAVLIDNGDGVLMADPGYPCNRNFVRMMGGVADEIAVGAETVRAAVVSGVRLVQVEVTLLVLKRAVGLDLVAVNPVRTAVRDVEQRLVRRERDAVGELQPFVHDLLGAVGLDEPDLAGVGVRAGPVRVGDVEVAVLVEGRAVHLVQASRQRPRHLHERGLARHARNPNRQSAMLGDAARDENRHGAGGGKDDAGRRPADLDLGQRTVNRQ